MKIQRVDVYGYDLHYIHGSYAMSDGRTVSELASTVVKLTTDVALVGWGEVCPLGPSYLPAFAEGVRVALRHLGPTLLGMDPCNLGLINRRMDDALRGHDYAKSPVDIACWDLLGKATGYSASSLLGGQLQEKYPLYIAVPLRSPTQMAEYVAARRAEGIHHFQLKIGADPYTDRQRIECVLDTVGDSDTVIADANGGWTLQDAMIAVRLLQALPRLFLEQPCSSFEECLYIRQHTTLPIVLDESVTDVHSLLRAYTSGAMEGVNLKISKVGGLTKAKLMRDLAETVGLKLTIEDTWGGDVVTAAISHLAASTKSEKLFTVSFMNDWVQEHIAYHQPRSHAGFGCAPEGPGLGVEVDATVLGEPLFSFGS